MGWSMLTCTAAVPWFAHTARHTLQAAISLAPRLLISILLQSKRWRAAVPVLLLLIDRVVGQAANSLLQTCTVAVAADIGKTSHELVAIHTRCCASLGVTRADYTPHPP